MTATSGMPRSMPSVAITGIRMSDATVWLTKVAAARQNNRIITSAIQGYPTGRAAEKRHQQAEENKNQPTAAEENKNQPTASVKTVSTAISTSRKYVPSVMPAEMYPSRPEEDTALPNTLPPPTRKIVCQDKLLKSTYSIHHTAP